MFGSSSVLHPLLLPSPLPFSCCDVIMFLFSISSLFLLCLFCLVLACFPSSLSLRLSLPLLSFSGCDVVYFVLFLILIFYPFSFSSFSLPFHLTLFPTSFVLPTSFLWQPCYLFFFTLFFHLFEFSCCLILSLSRSSSPPSVFFSLVAVIYFSVFSHCFSLPFSLLPFSHFVSPFLLIFSSISHLIECLDEPQSHFILYFSFCFPLFCLSPDPLASSRSFSFSFFLSAFFPIAWVPGE